MTTVNWSGVDFHRVVDPQEGAFDWFRKPSLHANFRGLISIITKSGARERTVTCTWATSRFKQSHLKSHHDPPLIKLEFCCSAPSLCSFETFFYSLFFHF